MKNTQSPSQTKSILCVDDDRDTCDLLHFLFDEYEFVSAHSVEDAFRLIENRRFDLYIFDNRLPDGSGIELCQKVRGLGFSEPIIFVSGLAEEKNVEEAVASGADKYLTKPCEPDLLKKVVKELID